jgi:hypothetical protein
MRDMFSEPYSYSIRLIGFRIIKVKGCYFYFSELVNSSVKNGLPSTPDDYQLLFSGHAIAQVVSYGLLIAAARVRAQVMWDLWWKSGTGAGFLHVLGFPLTILIPLTASHSSSSYHLGLV